MIEHKKYECEFCGKEFYESELDKAIEHENNCDCNPKNRKCGSCDYAIKKISYGVTYCQCSKLRKSNYSCNDWNTKKV